MNDDLKVVLGTIKTEAVLVDSWMRRDLARLRNDIDDFLFEVLEYGLFGGGKRVRPLLVVLASRLCGSQDENAYRLGCAFEYLHAATLFHDDIIDKSSLRRGRDSVYKRFGVPAAILAGDFLHALAMSTVGSLAGEQGLDIFCQATRGMVDGEFMQMRNARTRSLDEADYYAMIMGKTGLLISAACEIGALYGKGTTEQVLALRDYGTHLGCAFQIIDDLLDYQGNPEKTGKKVGGDLAEGKITLPLLIAMQNGGEGGRKKFSRLIAEFHETQVVFPEIYALIDRYEGFHCARQKAEEAAAHALQALSLFQANKMTAAYDVLEGLVGYVLTRKK